jgi:ubiquinone/menaquinone biosynthesis C-methylase UbiE
MSDKHYNISYLEDTSRVLKNFKERSYALFKTIQQGTILDLGCGTGLDVINMADLVSDAVQLVGIDHDPEMLNKARAAAGNKKNVDFVLSDACPLPYENDSVAGIRSERMIQHLENPNKVFQEIHRILIKNSPLVIMETDWRSLSFYNENHQIEKKINEYLTEVKVKNGMAARNLTSYLENCNFRNIQIDIHPVILRSLKEANDNLWIEKIIEEAAVKNVITQNECNLYKDSLHQADKKNYFVCSINLVITTSIK